MFHRSQRLLGAFALAAFIGCGAAGAQVTGTEIFVTNLQSCDWDNIVLTRAGEPHVVSFSLVPLGTNGPFGPQFDEADYIMEAFWVDSVGIVGGHDHVVAAGGNPGAYEAHHSQGATDYQGYRFVRKDGLPFSITSIDYRNAGSNLLIHNGPVVNAASITANAFSYGPNDDWILSNAAWRDFRFGYGGTQVFFTALDNCDFDNVVLSRNGVQETCTFNFGASLGNGAYGPTFAVGSYIFEAFWTTATGLSTGHTHISAAGGNPGSYEVHHFNTATDYQGYRVTRVDGTAFDLISIDYRNAASNLILVDVPLVSSASVLTFGTSYGPSEAFQLANPNWLTFDVGCTPDNGQAPRPGLATLDINSAREVCNDPVDSNLPGPYYSLTTMGGPFVMEITGTPNMPILFLIGDLNVGAGTFGAVGQLDIGGAPPGTGITTVFSGLDPGFSSIFYRTNAAGVFTMAITSPPLPPGIYIGSQAVVYGGPAVIALSNAVQFLTQ